jgi:hypothetical protein
MKIVTTSCTIFLMLAVVSAAPLMAEEWIIFDDEVQCGALTTHDGGFEVSDENPYEGKKCLARELVAGEWAWITGIGEDNPMSLDITGIDFDEAFIEFYIDSGKVVLAYIELRLAGQGWNPDCQAIIQTDGAEGYEQVRIPLKDFEVKNLGAKAKDLDDFTGGTGKIDTWSIGFSPPADTTVYVDELRIADSDEPEMKRAVEPNGKLTTLWASVKSSP